ncbi:synembryn isoform X2 [Vespula squamosa]|uniref:Synembryn isoform X2 n=1 Tax=Vespula squamosa TaxID=30214 RepID=A0ABD2AIP0_VESSQ
MDDLARKLISGTYEEFSKDTLQIFIKNYEDKTKIERICNSQLREQIWEKLFQYLSKSEYASMHLNCLAALRILSRDKTDLDKIVTAEMVTLLLRLAELDCRENEQQIPPANVSVESAKVLCNLLYHSFKVRELVIEKNCLENLINRINKYTVNSSHEMKLFDIKMLFIITALNTSTRNTVKQLNGDFYLLNILDELLEQHKSNISMSFSIKNDDVMLICDILKVLFNLYIHSEDSVIEEQEKNKKLTTCLYKFLYNKNWSKYKDLVSNVINLLTTIPLNNYIQMMQSNGNNENNIVYQNTDVTTVSVILEFLDQRLNYIENLLENLSPVVTVLIRLIKADKSVRKYVRLQVLPPLKDVMKRPEEGTTLKAKLCKLLTSPITKLRDIVAEFLFILCKENVSRMVKYTGYGNAAGMFANKGLLGRNQEKISYSESEDSDTEEYLKYKEQINPVTGCYEKIKPNLLESMTDEQKEYEALQLVNLVDQLTRGGIVRPCRIGDDGKPKPIEHVLELQDELQKQQYRRESDSD